MAGVDIRTLHVVYNNGAGLAAAHALIVAGADIKPTVTQNHTADAIRKNTTATGEINWPLVIRTLARREPGAGEA